VEHFGLQIWRKSYIFSVGLQIKFCDLRSSAGNGFLAHETVSRGFSPPRRFSPARKDSTARMDGLKMSQDGL
jgi:hypothetical protein